MFTIYSFFVPDIPCINCVQPVKEALRLCTELEVDDITFDPTTKEMSIRVPETLSDHHLRQYITETLKRYHHIPVFSDSLSLQAETRLHWIRGILGTAFGVVLLMMSLFIGPLSLGLMIPISLISIALTLWLGASSYQRSFKEWSTLKLSMDSLFAVSTVVVLAVSLVSFFVPWLPMMLDTGLLIFGFRHLGLAIEGKLTRAMQLDVRFVDRLPKLVKVLIGEQFEEQPLRSIQPGAILEIQPGDIIPLDGECLNDNHLIYDDIVTGAYLPRQIQKNERLLSGMRLAQGTEVLKLKVTQSFETSHLRSRDRRIAKAKFEKKADFEIFASKVLHYFIPIVFLLSVIATGVLAYFFSWAIAIRCGIGILVSACPCTLGLVVPLAMKIGMRKAADNGVQFHSAEQLQRAGEVDCVVLDLNGTLTQGVPVVTHSKFDASLINRTEFLNVIAAIEKNSEHPIGRAIYNYTQKQMPTNGCLLSNTQRHHFGVSTLINNQTYLLGNQRMMDDFGIDVSNIAKDIELNAGDSIVYLAREKKILGYIVLTDLIRKDAALLVDSLKKLGKKVFICTGADAATAIRCADELSIPHANIRASQRCSFDSNDKDDDKSLFIQQLKAKKYRVSMVGDAGNDALAIAASDFGLAIRSRGSDDVAQAEAGAVIYGSSLLPVISAFEISKQAVNNIKQNLIMSLGYNLITELFMGGALVALGVMLNPSIGVALMIVQMCLILANAQRFKQQALPHLTPLQSGEELNNDSTDQCSCTLSPRAFSNTCSLEADRAIVPQSLWATTSLVNAQPSPQYSLH